MARKANRAAAAIAAIQSASTQFVMSFMRPLRIGNFRPRRLIGKTAV
jgi:hypothetical protein